MIGGWVASWRKLALPLLLLSTLLVGARAGQAEDGDGGIAPAARAYLQTVEQKGPQHAWLALQDAGADPWEVVEQLLLLGESDEATRLAASPLTSDAVSLGAYAKVGEPAARELAAAVRAARADLEAEAPAKAVARLPASDAANLTVTDVLALMLRAEALDASDRPGEASSAYEAAALRAEAIGWSRAEATARRALLGREGLTGAGRRRHLQRLLAIDRDATDLKTSAVWSADLGDLLLRTGRLRSARRYLLEATSILDTLVESPGLDATQGRVRAGALADLATIHRMNGNVGASLAVALRAEACTRGQATQERRRALVVLADAYDHLLKLDEAIELLKEAHGLDVGVPAAEDTDLLMIKGNLARWYVVDGQIDEARAKYAEVMASPLLKGLPRARYVARIHVAAIEIDGPTEERSLRGLQKATLALATIQRDIDAEPEPCPHRVEIRENVKAMRGRALNLLGRFADAEAELRSAIESDYAVEVPEFRRYAQQELVHALRKQGKNKEAHALARVVLESWVQRVANVPDELAMNAMSTERLGEFVREYVAAAQALGAPEAVKTAVESTRGIAFLQETRRRRLRSRRARQDSDNQTIALLAADVARAARAHWRALSRPDITARRKAAEALWQARLRLRAVEEKAAVKRVEGRAEPAKPRGRPRRARAALRPREAMLYVAESDDRYVAVLHWRGETRLVPLGARADVDAAVRKAKDQWLGPDAGERRAGFAALAAATLPEPLVTLLVEAVRSKQALQHLYVSTAGVYTHVPWRVFVHEALRAKKLAADTLPGVTNIASAGVLRHVRDWAAPSGTGPMIVVGDPIYRTKGARGRRVAYFGSAPLERLPSSREEVEAIADEEQGDVLLMGTDATRERVRQELLDPEYPFHALHLSCHGLLYRARPWLSALALHPGVDDDGLLTVDEIAQFHLPRGPGLVVLAACDSGLGAPIAGEGEEGLVRAFQLAGARHVVASLWKVPDESTRDLMIAFHKARREQGLTPHAALLVAQRAIRAKEGATPEDWAAWVVWGPRD